MTRHPQRSAWLSLPDSGPTRRLRALLMALNVIPEAVSAEQAIRRLNGSSDAAIAGSALVLDVPDASVARVPGTLSFVQVLRAIPDPARRAAVTLTRVGGPHVSAAERDWALRSGFGAWLGDGSSFAPDSEAHTALIGMLARLGLGDVPGGVLAQTDRLEVGNDTRDAARRRCRRLIGLAPEQWVVRHAGGWPIADRRWRLRSYPRCMTGSGAVEHWMREHRIARDDAVALGRSLRAEGLLRHVVDEHEFEDAEYFYQVLHPQGPDAGELAFTLGAGIAVQDRSWRGRVYPQCWVGEQAVDLLAKAHGLGRVDAWLGLRRLMQLGCFEHVLREHPMRDGNFFYRFTPEFGRRG